MCLHARSRRPTRATKRITRLFAVRSPKLARLGNMLHCSKSARIGGYADMASKPAMGSGDFGEEGFLDGNGDGAGPNHRQSIVRCVRCTVKGKGGRREGR